MNKDDYPVFPDADAGADPAVPADQGGKGFTGEGWETNTTFDLIGDPHAVKGGTLPTMRLRIFRRHCELGTKHQFMEHLSSWFGL